ncbi:MAG: alpha/beta hydrolase [Acutalibacter sp.]|jgi:pimeloyl-ACP methyl ester carboxylesterase|uniref:alpha/beta hydrolase n=1 Tax=Acutalibacter sp. TaxID=1918636 RepID=UPI00216F1805|nr:alpha/beta hydrolase [Acutalibacter sp.]MCI9226285.1 alpha/beta hydrolase [Acutalibacter sp.]
MKSNIYARNVNVDGIPALVWGSKSEKVYIHVHGKMSRKEFAESFAVIAESKGYQTISFDLPEHGERAENNEYRCDIWNGIRDIKLIAGYAFKHWKAVFLYGSSLGAFFSLHAYKELPIKKCLFQSPIVDMEHLIKKMMTQFSVTEDDLRIRGEIPNPIDPLRWDYYQYVKANPITAWDIPTAILYGGKDWFQSGKVIQRFAQAHKCDLTVSPGREHAFMGDGDEEIVNDWYLKKI